MCVGIISGGDVTHHSTAQSRPGSSPQSWEEPRDHWGGTEPTPPGLTTQVFDASRAAVEGSAAHRDPSWMGPRLPWECVCTPQITCKLAQQIPLLVPPPCLPRPHQQTQNFCITFMQRRPNVFDVGPTLYKCYTKLSCLLGSPRSQSRSHTNGQFDIFIHVSSRIAAHLELVGNRRYKW